MMFGKRGRPPMRRTTSMTGITVTVDTGIGSEAQASDYRPKVVADEIKDSSEKQVIIMGEYDHQHQYSVPAMVSPRYQRRISSEGYKIEMANFLRTCGLCNRRLAPGLDIYMYRGDTAFCSMECREEQMKQDERKDKCNIKLNSNKTESHHNHSEFPSESSSNGETIAAA